MLKNLLLDHIRRAYGTEKSRYRGRKLSSGILSFDSGRKVGGGEGGWKIVDPRDKTAPPLGTHPTKLIHSPAKLEARQDR
jgi:hypothetical protein